MPAEGKSHRILIVEDEFLLAEMVAESLRDHGFEVRAVANAADALRHLASGQPCDVLFTDINLHDDVGGAQLSRLARKLRPDLPVVYASGAISSLDDLQAVPGASFIAKPYDPEAVCSKLADIADMAEAAH